MRGVSVAMVLVFITVGVGSMRLLLGNTDIVVHAVKYGVLHQTIYGAIAAAGFGVLFNFGYGNLVCAGAAGVVALAVRSIGLEAGWTGRLKLHRLRPRFPWRRWSRSSALCRPTSVRLARRSRSLAASR
ncbi:hypothetical protein [Breoghania sp.]|uniref:hypothetical protein n=1 Tax=Breoghania sp. TaxID=2065378 RepID=UPI00262E3147|nr:hypothetical protein [Breoghania sp.]MDJ0933479.1 hypothetical protein [Breoghania sp.]